ncbi:hypothetical protein VTK73DRAFT_3496 [Phialemonium thermophilum]|uniref:Uncharacterized protein n=1 Tax=Phialemonium thermophilum TaxID=223376 RepID=A0ABR3VI84_9PEZI
MILGITALGHRTDDWARSLSRSLKVTFGLDPDAEPSASPTSSSAKQVSSVISLYNLDDASATAAAAEAKKDIAEVKRLGVLHFLNDLAFAEAAIATARAWTLPLPPAGAGTPRSFLTHFHCPNPWPGPYTGSATHALDAAFALQNYDAYLPQGQRACAERMGRDLVLFVDGKRGDPFPPLGADETGAEMVYFAQPEGGKGDESAPVPTAQAKTEGRRGKLAQVTGGSPEFLDKLMAALGLFLQGPQ